MTVGLTSLGPIAVAVAQQTALRRCVLLHLRAVGGVRTLAELAAELGRDADLLLADLDVLEAEGVVWHRDLITEPESGGQNTETCWWAPRVPPAQQEGER